MTSLKNLQSFFQNYLMAGNSEGILPHVAPSDTFSAERRLGVYYHGYRLRLLEVLRLDFPKLHILMGDHDFESSFIQYCDEYPSRHFSVRYFGDHFPEFLSKTLPFSNFTLLSEMATFEWTVAFTLDAPDAPLVTVEQLSALKPDEWIELTFTFHPSVITQYFAWDTPQLWQHIDSEKPPREAILQPEPIRWIFWRHHIKSYFQSCTKAQDVLFQSVYEGLCFADICEALLPFVPENEVPTIAAQTLYKWVNEGLITSFST